eukprot:2712496-Prymnesium_polylepis.1
MSSSAGLAGAVLLTSAIAAVVSSATAAVAVPSATAAVSSGTASATAVRISGAKFRDSTSSLEASSPPLSSELFFFDGHLQWDSPLLAASFSFLKRPQPCVPLQR